MDRLKYILISGTITITLLSASLQAKSDLLQIYEDSQKQNDSTVYLVPSPSQLESFNQLILDVIDLARDHDKKVPLPLIEKASGFGFDLKYIDKGKKQSFYYLIEKNEHRYGKGFYLFRTNSKNNRPAVIQSPHSLSDQETGVIGFELFLSSSASAFFSSTVKRDVKCLDSSEEDPGDLAHTTNSYFHAATQGYSQKHPDLLVIQIHGFEEKAYDPHRDYSIILSSGRRFKTADQLLTAWVSTLESHLTGQKIGVYGRDTNDLGATTNIQGIFIAKKTSGKFLHIELSQEFRNRLVQSRKTRSMFQKALQQVVAIYEKN